MQINMKRTSIISSFLVMVLLFLTPAYSLASGIDNSNVDTGQVITKDTVREFIDTLTESDYEQDPYLERTVSELEELLSKDDEFSLQEVNEILDKYTYQSKSEMDLNDLETLQNELARIDESAQEFYAENYDFYEQNGYFPEEDESMSFTVRSTNAMALGLLKQYGVRWTESQLVARLATLGAIAAIDGPVPVGDFIALIGGAVILSPHFDNYVDNLNGIKDFLESVSLRDAISRVTGAVELTSEAKYEIRRNRVKHFTARLAFDGYAGVQVQNPISLSAAQLRARNGKDTFSVRKSRAEQVVDQDGYSFYDEGPHLNLGQLANLPHYHLTEEGNLNNKLRGHHFFPYDPLD